MTSTEAAKPQVTTVRKIPITLSLAEVDVDGARRWVVVYEANVDGTEHAAATVDRMIGPEESPQAALDLAAQRIGPLGF
jgi:hypothetical protein